MGEYRWQAPPYNPLADNLEVTLDFPHSPRSPVCQVSSAPYIFLKYPPCLIPQALSCRLVLHHCSGLCEPCPSTSLLTLPMEWCFVRYKSMSLHFLSPLGWLLPPPHSSEVPNTFHTLISEPVWLALLCPPLPLLLWLLSSPWPFLTSPAGLVLFSCSWHCDTTLGSGHRLKLRLYLHEAEHMLGHTINYSLKLLFIKLGDPRATWPFHFRPCPRVSLWSFHPLPAP